MRRTLARTVAVAFVAAALAWWWSCGIQLLRPTTSHELGGFTFIGPRGMRAEHVWDPSKTAIALDEPYFEVQLVEANSWVANFPESIWIESHEARWSRFSASAPLRGGKDYIETISYPARRAGISVVFRAEPGSEEHRVCEAWRRQVWDTLCHVGTPLVYPDPDATRFTTVEGVVLDPAGAPLVGKELFGIAAPFWKRKYFHDSDWEFAEGTTRFRVTTDEQGRFRSPEIENGKYWIGLAPAEDVAPYVPLGDLVDVVGWEPVETIELVAHEARWIEGVVRTPDGAPYADAWVSADPHDAIASLWTETDADGRFRLGPVAHDRFRLNADPRGESSGYAESPWKNSWDGATDLELVLQPECSIRVRVHDSETAEVWVVRRDFDLERDYFWTGGWMGHGGEKYDSVPPGLYYCVAKTEDGRMGYSPRFELETGERVVIDVELREMGTVVVTHRCDEPVARIRAFQSEQLVAEDDWAERGAPTTLLVPAGPIFVSFEEYGSGRRWGRSCEVEPGGTTEIAMSR